MFRVNYGTDNNEPPRKPEPTKEVRAKLRIEEAKQKGIEELELFDKSYKKFLEETKDLVIFHDVLTQIELSVEHLITNVTKPILFGQELYGVPDALYKSIRKDLYKMLIEHYKIKGDTQDGD